MVEGRQQSNVDARVSASADALASEGGSVEPDGTGVSWRSDRTGIVWAVVLIGLVALGSFSWFDQVKYEPPIYGDDEATRAALEDLRVVAVGEELSMAATAPSRWIMGDGFGIPEDDGSWIVAIRAGVSFHVEATQVSSIDLKLYPLLAAVRPTRLVSVTSMGGSTEVVLTGGEQWVSAPLSGGQFHQVNIKCGSVDSPLSLGLGPDQRALCAKLVAVRVNR